MILLLTAEKERMILLLNKGTRANDFDFE